MPRLCCIPIIRTIEKGIVLGLLALAQYLQATPLLPTVATRPTPPAAFVFYIFYVQRVITTIRNVLTPESWPVTQLNLLRSISTVRVMTTTSTSVGSVCCISTIKLINNRDTASPRMCISINGASPDSQTPGLHSSLMIAHTRYHF